MRTMSNYLIIMFSVILFIFRLIVVFTTVWGIDFMIKSTNVNYEIIFLFIMLISIILLSKNKLTGAILFLISSIAYYGPSLLNIFSVLSSSNASMDSITEMVVSLIGIILPLFAFFIIAAAKKQEAKPVDKKTDFFYKNEAYDRKYDERADKNNYKTL